MPVFTLNGCTCISTDSRWLYSPLPFAHTHTYYTYNFPRVSLASLTYLYRETHMPIVKLHVHPDHIGDDSHIYNRDIQILCTLHWGHTLTRKCTKTYGGNLPNCTAAIYQTLRRQSTNLKGGNVPHGTAAIGVGGLGGNLTKYPGKSRKPKSPYPVCITTIITSLVAEMSPPNSRKRIMELIPLHTQCRKWHNLIQETEEWL